MKIKTTLRYPSGLKEYNVDKNLQILWDIRNILPQIGSYITYSDGTVEVRRIQFDFVNQIINIICEIKR